MQEPLQTEPGSADVADATIHVEVRRDDATGDWRVLVLVVRQPHRPRLEAADLTAELTDESGASLPLVERDEGPLVEAGGSLGMSTNANFRFAPGSDPREIRVGYRGEDLVFHLRTDQP